MRARKSVEPVEPVLCAYGCGRVAIGSLSLHFHEWRERKTSEAARGPDGGFSVYLPACVECVRGAVQIRVSIPDERKGSK